ncbi:MAG TPA: hypothetical protein VLE43_14155 [Candidatus Saccharimonadia bacterium]|nr:hypothetical protein [Candidatus Saccharimonadia bacterium]
MPDVGLTSATAPLPKNAKVIIKYSVEVEGLPVYNESYDAEKLAKELQEDEANTILLWARRIKCLVCCRKRPGFSACLTRCLNDGRCCDHGSENAENVDAEGRP